MSDLETMTTDRDNLQTKLDTKPSMTTTCIQTDTPVVEKPAPKKLTKKLKKCKIKGCENTSADGTLCDNHGKTYKLVTKNGKKKIVKRKQ